MIKIKKDEIGFCKDWRLVSYDASSDVSACTERAHFLKLTAPIYSLSDHTHPPITGVMGGVREAWLLLPTLNQQAEG